MKISKITMALIAACFLTSANAGYRMQMPLEIDGGGHLPNRSIVFTGETEIEPVDNEIEPVDNEIEPVDKAKECDDNASKVPGFLSSTYPDVNYISHGFYTYEQYVPGVGFVDVEGCEVTIALPKSKSFSCIYNNNYSLEVNSSVLSLGIDSVRGNQYGECN
ncbi:hypothetical protein PX74_003758 [Salmonella enterica subsp. enterica]|nr:hypothetical protein [Salmonella enterica subsp. enterica]